MGVGVELKGGKKPEQGRFFNFFFLAKGSQRREGKEENYNPWFRLSYAGKYIFLASPHAKKKKKKSHLELCTDSNYVMPAISLLCLNIPRNGCHP